MPFGRREFNTAGDLVLENTRNAIQSMRTRDLTHVGIPISQDGVRKEN